MSCCKMKGWTPTLILTFVLYKSPNSRRHVVPHYYRGTFKAFLALSETATIELFWVSHLNNTSNLQPFHFTSSHLHVRSTFNVLPPPPPTPRRQSPPPCSSTISSKLLNCAKLPQLIHFFRRGGGNKTWQRFHGANIWSRVCRGSMAPSVNRSGSRNFYYFWRFFISKQTGLELPQAAPHFSPAWWNRWCNASHLASFNFLVALRGQTVELVTPSISSCVPGGNTEKE